VGFWPGGLRLEVPEAMAEDAAAATAPSVVGVGRRAGPLVLGFGTTRDHRGLGHHDVTVRDVTPGGRDRGVMEGRGRPDAI